MSVHDLPCDSEPKSDADREGPALKALYRTLAHYGSEPQDREASAILALHWAIQLAIARVGLIAAGGVCLNALRRWM